MRPQSAPAGLRLAMFVVFAANFKTSPAQYHLIDHTAPQEHLVCKKPDSQLCVTWHLGPVDPDIIIEESPSNATQFCGLSDLKRILPHRKFITVKSLARGGQSKAIFCKLFTKLKGDVLNWKQVEKALNMLSRSRRQTASLPRGRYRGQTQSQYLAIDRGNGKDEGKAEAHSAADSSRASVSGNSGMGQAQSQSVYDPNCDDCYGKSDHEVESLKRGPYVPGNGGNRYAPVDGYGSSGSYRPGQGSSNGLDTGIKYGGGNGDLGTGRTPGGRPGGNVGYGPNGQLGGSGIYSPGHGNEPGTSHFRPSPGATPGGALNGNSGYGPSGQPSTGNYMPSGITPGGSQGGNGLYEPGQGSGPSSGYGPSGIEPGSNQGGKVSNRGYGSGQGNGLGPGYGPGQGSGLGPGYGPGQGSGLGPGYGPGQGSGLRPGYGPPGLIPVGSSDGMGGNGGYGPSQGSGLVSGYEPSGMTPGDSQGRRGENGYNPGQTSDLGSHYGPSEITPGGHQGKERNGGYVPGQGGGPGITSYGPSPGLTPGSNQGGSGYGPGGQQGGSGGYGPSQANGPGNSGYGPSGSISKISPGGSGGNEPSQGHGQNTGYIPGQNVGNGINYRPSPNEQRLIPGGTQGNTIGPQQSYVPGQSSVPGGVYGPVQNSSPGGSGGYPIQQGPITNTGYSPVQNSIPGSNGSIPPGANVGYGQTNSVGPSSSGSNWPLALGPFPGPPGSSVYCCVVPNNSGQNIGIGENNMPGYPPHGIQHPGTGSSAPSYFINKPSGGPGNLYGPAYGPGNIGSGNVQGAQGPNNLNLPGTYDKGLIGGPVNGGPYAIGNINSPSSPYGRDTAGGPGTYAIGNTGGPGGQNGIQGPGSYGAGIHGDPRLQQGVQQPGIYGGREGQNNIQTSGGNPAGGQKPGYFGTGPTGGSGGQNGIQVPGNFGTGPTGGLESQNGMQRPGNFGSSPTGGSGGENGMQRPGNYGTGPIGGSGQNGIQGPGNYGTGPTDGSGQNGIQGPGNYATGPTGGLGQNGIQGPGNYGGDLTGGSGQNGIQGPGNYGTGPTGGPGQNGIQGPGNYGTLPTSGSGQNGIQGPGNYGVAPTGGSGQNEIQGPVNYGTRPTGGSGQNGIQGPGNYGTSPIGGLGQNGLQGPGNYGTGPTGGAGNQSGMQRPGIYGTGTPGMPGGLQGTGTYGTPGIYTTSTSGDPNRPSGLNIPSNQGGGENAWTNGAPGRHEGQNGNTIPDSGLSGKYPGIPNSPSSQGPGAGIIGSHGQQPQEPIDSSRPGNQQGFDSQGNPLQSYENNGIPQNYLDPNSIAIDGDDSEAEAIVNQAANGTTASASSKGGNDKGRAQTHVHGTYTGGGSFQAQAQITGENKEAESEVSGGKKGASSSATGAGRNNKSLASVQLGSETGSVQTQSQSNGAMHSSNSQVQGSVKGGMADAQAKGPGSTSSQAQIGFTPYKDGDKMHDLLQTPFVGGGVASAQSSGRTGQSQSQLHGTFKYGITYNGAAQAGASLDKDAVFPNRLNFEKIDVFDESQKNINVNTEIPKNEIPPTELIPLSEAPIETKTKSNTEDETTTEKGNDESMKNSESRYLSHTHLDHHKPDTTLAPSPTAAGSRRSFQPGYENVAVDYEYTTDKDEIPPEEYDTDPGYGVEGNDATDVEQPVGEEFSNYDEYSRDYQTHQSLQSPRRKGIEVQQSTGGNTQHIVLGSLNNRDVEITQRNSEKPDESKVYQPGERVPGTGGYRIPIGFTGSVKSVASKDKTYVVGSKHSPSQAQTVTLTPGTGKVNYVYPPNYGKYISPKDLRSLHNQNPKDDRYVSVSKSVTRALDAENNIRKQYSHTYYTKSSSCGYFTFTCTMVSGVDGRKKVCKPKIPTNPDGTPIRC